MWHEEKNKLETHFLTGDELCMFFATPILSSSTVCISLRERERDISDYKTWKVVSCANFRKMILNRVLKVYWKIQCVVTKQKTTILCVCVCVRVREN